MCSATTKFLEPHTFSSPYDEAEPVTQELSPERSLALSPLEEDEEMRCVPLPNGHTVVAFMLRNYRVVRITGVSGVYGAPPYPCFSHF